MMAASGMAIDSWGPKAWGFLHAASFKYPDKPLTQDRLAWSNLLQSLAIVLPCAVCRKHFAAELARVLPERENARILDSRDTLTRWLVDVHNDVNARNKKRLWTYEEVEQVYQPSEHICAAMRPPAEAAPDAHDDAHEAGGLALASLRDAILSASVALVLLLILLTLVRSNVCRSCR